MPNITAQANREKRRAALGSLLAALVLTTFKIVVGVLTNSLGVLSEAAHSGLDLLAAGLSLWAVRAAGQPADREHTYGHGKFETLSALAETLLLLCTCAWIIYEACRRLFLAEQVRVNASVWAFLVIALSIAVDFSRSRILGRTARKYGSQALEADALHFSTDIWSSCVVLAGLLGVWVCAEVEYPLVGTGRCGGRLGRGRDCDPGDDQVGQAFDRRPFGPRARRPPGPGRGCRAGRGGQGSYPGPRPPRGARILRRRDALGQPWRPDRGRRCDCQQCRRTPSGRCCPRPT